MNRGRRIVNLARALADGDSLPDLTPEADDGIFRALREISRVHAFHRSSTDVDDPSLSRQHPRWGYFDILDQIGEGGYGAVYLALDTKLGRHVALKLLRDDNTSRASAASLVREGENLARINHPNVATVYGVDEHDGRVGIWMEYIKGRPLIRVLEEHGTMSEREAALVGLDVCRALAAVHGQGLLHRDVKAENILREEGGRYVLTDFGIGMRIAETLFASPAGTPLYLAPEVLNGNPPSIKTDIYAVGVLLFNLVTKQFPVMARDLAELKSMHRNSRARLLRDVRPGLSPAFLRVVECATEADPEKRYSTSGEMERTLTDALALSQSETHARTMGPLRDAGTTFARRFQGRLVLLLSIVFAVVLLVLVGSPWVFDPPDAIPTGVSNVPTIAVMSFDNLSGDPGLDWLSTGLAELIATDLAQSSRLEVVPMSSVVKQRGDTQTIATAGSIGESNQEVLKSLEASALVVGSFSNDGGLQISLQVRDDRGQLLANETVRGELSEDLFSMVDLLSVPVRQSLLPQSSPDELLDRELSDVTTRSPEAYRYYAEALALQYQGKYMESIPLYEKAVEIDSGFALALTKLSILSGLAGQIDGALAYSSRAVEHIDSVSMRERYYIEGNHYSWREETYGHAIASFERAVDLYPDHWAARHNLGIMYWELERYQQAILRFEETRQRRPELTALYRPLALSYAGSGDPASSLQVIHDWIAVSDGAWNAYRELGRIHTLWGNTEGAMQAYQAAEEAAPRVFDLDEDLWRVHVVREDWSSLDEWIEQRAASRTDGDEVLVRALAFLYRGRTQDAVEALERSLGQADAVGRIVAATHRMAADVVLLRGEYAETVKRARRAQATGVGDLGEWEGLYLEALATGHLADWENAYRIAERLATRTTSLPTLREKCRLHLLRGNLALLQGNASDAVDELEKAASYLPPKGIFWTPRIPPLHVLVWFALGDANLALGDVSRAEELFQRIVNSKSERFLWPLRYALSLRRLAQINSHLANEVGARAYEQRAEAQWSGGDLDYPLSEAVLGEMLPRTEPGK